MAPRHQAPAPNNLSPSKDIWGRRHRHRNPKWRLSQRGTFGLRHQRAANSPVHQPCDGPRAVFGVRPGPCGCASVSSELHPRASRSLPLCNEPTRRWALRIETRGSECAARWSGIAGDEQGDDQDEGTHVWPWRSEAFPEAFLAFTGGASGEGSSAFARDTHFHINICASGGRGRRELRTSASKRCRGGCSGQRLDPLTEESHWGRAKAMEKQRSRSAVRLLRVRRRTREELIKHSEEATISQRGVGRTGCGGLDVSIALGAAFGSVGQAFEKALRWVARYTNLERNPRTMKRQLARKYGVNIQYNSQR